MKRKRAIIRTASLFPALLFFSVTLWSQQYRETFLGVKTTINAINVEVQFFNPQIARVVKYPTVNTPDKKSLSIIKTPEKTSLKVARAGNFLSVSSNALQVKINLQTGDISFYRESGELLLKEKEVKFIPVKDSTENTFTVSQTFALDSSEAIYGLGQHQNGIMNQRHQKIILKQDNREIGIPFFQSTKGYGLFWDNYSTTIFNDTDDGTSFSSQVGSGADYYFINGGSADKVVAGMRELTGQAPMFPRWAFGYWQCRERYKSQFELMEVVKKYRSLKVPLDGIIQDWQYWGEDNGFWNSTEFGNPNYPDPKAMIDSVHQANAHIIISVWPSFGNKTKIFTDMKKEGLLYNFTTWPVTPVVQPYDAFNPRARNIYWGYMNRNLFSLGIDGWWLDSTEPDHLREKESDDNTNTYLGTFRKMRNAFPLVTTGGVYAHQRETSSAKRVFILARSAFAGQQRNGAAVWSGDIGSRWDVLRAQISAGCNLSLSGIPYWNSDIGGFFSYGKYPLGVKDPAFQELYVRWLQFGAFCPVFRSHGTDTPREIYQFGQKGYWAYDAIEKFINLRYRLQPYIYANAWAVTSSASTIMRALVMDFSGDKRAQNINNEYLFGKSLLVCPVTDSLYTSRANGAAVADFSKTKTQKVYLPRGADWFDFWTGELTAGGKEIEKEVPIDIMPLYVKAGSVLPMGPFQQYTGEKDAGKLELRVYEGANGTFILYEDENNNYNYEKGMYATITVKWNDKTKTLTIEDCKGAYPGMLHSRTFDVVVVKKDHGQGIGTTGNPDKMITYKGKKLEVKL